MGVKADDYPDALAAIRRFTNFHGALITMPHKVTTVALLDEAAAVARADAQMVSTEVMVRAYRILDQDDYISITKAKRVM